ncbi:hypothetical protein SKPI104516_07015 [Skermania piniformis]|nr:hypothetical protein [Skermania piniformis]
MPDQIMPGRNEPERSRIEKGIVSLLDNASRLQAPAVIKYVDKVRADNPDDSPAELIERLEDHFLLAVTGSGGAVGAAAAVPGIGTVTAIGAAAAEGIFFLEASALLTLAVAHVHGIDPADNERRRALVLAVALGDTGMQIVQRTVGRSSKNWASTMLAGNIPGLSGMNDSLLKRFVIRYITRRSLLMFGKIIPAGIGAVIGGIGNRAIGKQVVNNARKAFGPAPATWSAPVVIDAEPQGQLDPARKV